MKARLLSAGALALCLLTGPAQSDVDVGIWFEGAAIHGDGFSLYIGGPYYHRDRYIVTRPHYTRHYYRYDSPRDYRHKRFGHRPHHFDHRHGFRYDRRFDHGRKSRHDFRDHRRGGAIDRGRRGSRIGDTHYFDRHRFDDRHRRWDRR